ncbi:helix-turn-helix domain-containing protein [Paucibacter sediminis]|uniref:Helix-turn-helix domain-containing protein n=1 Tax=Paucibacter sediminis TaxID=3019553 RepID=A0AA95SNM3_9BURK|nr:helix-turn-helix domain-containing protein [Paucibacter sp. S2-9]WIT11420.1 helix-turn-helix domain-containing protein [Paucibacter sp. S2-9]
MMAKTPPERIKALHAIRDRHQGDTSAPQRARLLEALQTLGHCTTFEASRYLDLYDPRARKLDLVKQGYAVLTTWRVVQTESGECHRIGVYSLLRGRA